MLLHAAYTLLFVTGCSPHPLLTAVAATCALFPGAGCCSCSAVCCWLLLMLCCLLLDLLPTPRCLLLAAALALLSVAGCSSYTVVCCWLLTSLMSICVKPQIMLSAPYLESCTAQYICLRLWGKAQSFPENDIFTSPFCFPVWGKAWVTMPKVVAADHLRGG